MNRHVAMNELVDDIKSFAERDFPEEDIHTYLSETLVAPKALERYVELARTAIPDTWSTKTKTSSSS